MARRRASDVLFATLSQYQSPCHNAAHNALAGRSPSGAVRRLFKISTLRSRHHACAAFSSITSGHHEGKTVKEEEEDLQGHAEMSAFEFPKSLNPKPPPQIAALHRQYPQLDFMGFWSTLVENAQLPYSLDEASAAMSLQQVMRSAPHSTVLITAFHDSAPHKQSQKLVEKRSDQSISSPIYKGFYGAVISSMTTVTMGPPAIISFNLKVPSQTLTAVMSSGYLTIHFLEASPEGAYVAQTFLRNSGNHERAWQELSRSHFIANMPQYVIMQDEVTTRCSVPRILGKGIASHLTCRIIRSKCVHNVSDHSIVVAKVTNQRRDSWQYQEDSLPVEEQHVEYPPLLMYSQKRFRSHGIVIEEDEKSIPSIPDGILSKDEYGVVKHPRTFSPGHILEPSANVLYQAVHRFVSSIVSDKSGSGAGKLRRMLVDMQTASNSRKDASARIMYALRLWRSRQQLNNIDATDGKEDYDSIYASLQESDDDPVLRTVSDVLVTWADWNSNQSKTRIEDVQSADAGKTAAFEEGSI